MVRAKPATSIRSVLWRFVLGAAGGIGAGWIVFGPAVFRVTDRAFHCVTIGLLTAGVIALMRASRPGPAIGLALGFGLIQLGLADAFGWPRAVAGMALSAGIVLVAWIFDLLAREGVLIGKFLVAGPLLGGVYLATAPLAEFHTMTWSLATDTLVGYAYLGLIIGDGVGFGAEIVDLIEWVTNRMVGRRVGAQGATRT